MVGYKHVSVAEPVKLFIVKLGMGGGGAMVKDVLDTQPSGNDTVTLTAPGVV